MIVLRVTGWLGGRDAVSEELSGAWVCRQVKADADKNRARLGSLAALAQDFDWGNARRPQQALEDLVVLEVHPPTFTADLVRRARRVCRSLGVWVCPVAARNAQWSQRNNIAL